MPVAAQNIVFLGKDNPVVIKFTFDGEFLADGLSNFTNIIVNVSTETYTLLLNPTNVIVFSNTELRIAIGTDTALTAGSYDITVTGISANYDDGYILIDEGELDSIIVK